MNATPLFNAYRVSEYIQFYADVLKLCSQNTEAATQVQTQLDAFTASTQALQNTFKVSQASDITTELSELDARRDQLIICLRKMADAYTDHYDPDLQAAAKTLLNCIDKYGKRIYHMNYQAQTSTMSNLGNELTTDDEMKTVVSTLNLADIVEKMNGFNNQFNNRFLSRVTENTEDQHISSGEAIKQAVTDYRSMMEHLNAYSIISPSESNTKLLAEIGTLITQYNTTVEQRSGKKEGASEEAA